MTFKATRKITQRSRTKKKLKMGELKERNLVSDRKFEYCTSYSSYNAMQIFIFHGSEYYPINFYA